MRVPRQPAYYRLTEPVDRPADASADGPGADPDPWGDVESADRPRWPRWVALVVAAAVLLTAGLGWTTRESAPLPAPPPATTLVDEAPDEPPPRGSNRGAV